MLTVASNLAALDVQRNLAKSTRSLTLASAALGSGLRVSSAQNDAAGLAVATRMSANLRANRAVARGVNDGMSIAQTAEGALGGISEILQRCVELATQASNGSLTDTDRAFINTEFHQLLLEVDRTANGATIFGKSPLHAPEVVPAQAPVLAARGSTPSFQSLFGVEGSNGPGGSALWLQPAAAKVVGYIPAGLTNVNLDINSAGGDADVQLFGADGTHIVGTPLTDPSWATSGTTSAAAVNASIVNTAKGFDAGASYSGPPLIQVNPPSNAVYNNSALSPAVTASYHGMNIGYTGDGDRFADDTVSASGFTDSAHGREGIFIDRVTEPLFAVISARALWAFVADWTVPGSTTKPGGNMPVDIVVGAAIDGDVDTIRIDNTPADTSSLGIGSADLGTASGARAALDSLAAALTTVSGYRATFGALSNRFEVAASNLGQEAVNVESARSRILDADIAETVSERTRGQALQDIGTTLLAQSSKTPEFALSLLR